MYVYLNLHIENIIVPVRIKFWIYFSIKYVIACSEWVYEFFVANHKILYRKSFINPYQNQYLFKFWAFQSYSKTNFTFTMSETEKRDNLLRFALLSITGIVSSPSFTQKKFCGLQRPSYTSSNSINNTFIGVLSY